MQCHCNHYLRENSEVDNYSRLHYISQYTVFESSDMVRRSRFDHYCDVLQVIEQGVEKPTRIMYKANLTYKILQDIVATLVLNRFIREEISGEKRRYYITRKGKNALHHDRRNLQKVVAIR